MKFLIPVVMMTAYILSIAPAQAAVVKVIDEQMIYNTETIYETVEVCTKGDDKTTEGALLGGLFGSQSGKALEGAILGGILGDLAGETKCKTERRAVGSKKVYSHTMVTLEVNGVRITVRTP